MIESNSITRYLTPDSIANNARMTRVSEEKRTGQRIAIVIVEGYADKNFYTNVLDITKCSITNAFGKDNVIQVLRILISQGTQGILGIVDNDYDSLDGHSNRDNFVLVTDTHDLETLLINSRALDKLLSTLLPQEMLSYLSVYSNSVRKNLVELGSPLGYIRWISIHENIGLDFRQIRYENFININGLRLDTNACINEVISKNPGCKFTAKEIQNKVEKSEKKEINPWQICQGHDLIRIFLIIIPVLLRPYAPKTGAKRYFDLVITKIPDENRITEQLIMCYEQEEFRKTSIYDDIKQWENRNPPYQLARN